MKKNFTLVYRGSDPTLVLSKKATRSHGLARTSQRQSTGVVKAKRGKKILASGRRQMPRAFGASGKRIPLIAPPSVSAPAQKTKIGIWDLGSRTVHLEKMIRLLNQKQKSFEFWDVAASVPAGFISQPEKVITWANSHSPHALKDDDAEKIERHLIANEFYSRAEKVRIKVQIDFIVGLTPSKIASKKGSKIRLNSTIFSSKNIIIISVSDVNVFAKSKQVSFNSTLLGYIFAQIFKNMFTLREVRAEENASPHFNYDGKSNNVVLSQNDLRITDQWQLRVPANYRSALLQILKATQSI